MRGATCPIASPTYPYRPCGTGVPGEQPPVHVVFMAALGTVLSSPQRFCLGEAPAAQWPFNGVQVPWILPEGYRNPGGPAPDFPGDDNQAEDSNGKGSGTAPGGPSATSGNDKEDDDDEGFETVDDEDEDTGDKVVVKIPIKDLAKPGGSGLMGVDRLFESDDEEDDAELKEQIEAAYKTADTMDELKLSETSSSSNSGSSDSDDDEDDPNVTRQYPVHPEAEGMEEVRPYRLLPPTRRPYRLIPAIPAVPTRGSDPNRILRKPRAPKGRVRTVRNPERLRLPRHNFRPLPKEYGSRHKQRSSGVPHWHRRRPWDRKKRLLAVWKITPACSTDSRNW